MAEREVKIRFSGDAKALKGTAGDIRTLFANMTDDINDSRGAGAKLGDAMKQAADKAAAELKQLDDTVAVVADSLGPEMTAAIEQSNKGIADYIAEWRKMGLTFDDIKAESQSLADGLKALDGSTRRSTEEVGAGLAKVGHEADNSRSVLANMVGNSAQDLGELGGIAGTTGVALGQLAEYASEGNISLGGFAKVAGPMAAVGLAVAALSSVMEENAKQQKFLRDQTLQFADALETARKENKSTTKAIVDDWASGGKIEAQISNATATMVEFGEATDDMGRIHDLKYPTAQKRVVDFAVEIDKLGMKAEDMAMLAQQPIDKIQEWGAEMVASGKDAAQVNLVMQGAAALHVRLADAAATDAVNARVFGDSMKDAAAKGGPFNKVLDAVRSNADKAAKRTEDLNKQIDILLGKLDEQEAWKNIDEALWNLNDGVGDSEQEMRDLIRAYVDFITTTDTIPESKKVELIAALNAGDVKKVQQFLDKLALGVRVPITFTYPMGAHPVITPGGAGPDGERRTINGGGTRTASPVVINVMSADPKAVIEAQKRYAANGGQP